MSNPILDPVVRAIKAGQRPDKQEIKLATITDVNATGMTLTFDGESTASAKRFRATAAAVVGDRVVMARTGSGWVCLGKIHVGPVIQADENDSVTTNGSGVATVTFRDAYPAAPAVVVSPRSGFAQATNVTSTATGFTFNATDSAGGALANTAITFQWIAHPQNQ